LNAENSLDPIRMRKTLLAICLWIPGVICAQNYTRDAGIRVGDFVSVSYRQFQDDFQALEGVLFIGRRGMTIGVLKEHFEPAFGQISENIVFKYGYGAHAGFRSINHYRILNRKYELETYRFTPLIGIDGLIGLEYQFPEIPFLAGIDIKPYVEFSIIQIFSLYLQSVGFSIKYRF